MTRENKEELELATAKMKTAAVVLSLMHAAAAASHDVQVNVHWPSFLSRHDMAWDWQ